MQVITTKLSQNISTMNKLIAFAAAFLGAAVSAEFNGDAYCDLYSFDTGVRGLVLFDQYFGYDGVETMLEIRGQLDGICATDGDTITLEYHAVFDNNNVFDGFCVESPSPSIIGEVYPDETGLADFLFEANINTGLELPTSQETPSI